MLQKNNNIIFTSNIFHKQLNNGLLLTDIIVSNIFNLLIQRYNSMLVRLNSKFYNDLFKCHFK